MIEITKENRVKGKGKKTFKESNERLKDIKNKRQLKFGDGNLLLLLTGIGSSL